MEYKVGDRVFCYDVVGDGDKIGGDGTVVHLHQDDQIGVAFDRFIGGHNCTGHCTQGYGWYCLKSMLEPKIKKVFEQKEAVVIDIGCLFSHSEVMAKALGVTNWKRDIIPNISDEVLIINTTHTLKESHPSLYNDGGGAGTPICLVKRKSDGQEFLIGAEGLTTILNPKVGEKYSAREIAPHLKVGMFIRWGDDYAKHDFFVGEVTASYLYLWSNYDTMKGLCGEKNPTSAGFLYSIRAKKSTMSTNTRIEILETINPIFVTVEEFNKQVEKIKSHEPEDIVESYRFLKEKMFMLEDRMKTEFRTFTEKWSLLLGLKDWVGEIECRDANFRFVVSEVGEDIEKRISKVRSMGLQMRVKELEGQLNANC